MEKKNIIIISMIIILVLFAAFLIFHKAMKNSQNTNIKPTENNRDVSTIEKIDYSIQETTKIDSLSINRYDTANGYFEFETRYHDDIDESILRRYDEENRLLWESEVFYSFYLHFLKIDEENDLIYLLGEDYNADNFIKCIGFNGKEIFNIIEKFRDIGKVKYFYDLIINSSSFTVIYAYSGELYTYYQASYSNDGIMIEENKLFPFDIEYLGCVNNKIFIYNNENNSLLIKELNSKKVSEISIKNYIVDIYGVMKSGTSAPISKKLNKVIFFANINSSDCAIIVYDYIENKFYWTDIIVELNNKDILYYWFIESGDLYIAGTDSENYLITLDLK